MPQYVCEFCKLVDDEESKEAFAYLYGGATIAFCCIDCAGSHIATDDLAAIILPEGWEIVKTKELDELRVGNKAFEEARIAMISGVQTWHVSAGYQYDLAGFFERIQAFFEGRENSQIAFRERLGLTSFEMDVISAAHCPNCAGPMINLVTIDQEDSLKYADCNQDVISKAMDAPSTLACLNCAAAYVDYYVD